MCVYCKNWALYYKGKPNQHLCDARNSNIKIGLVNYLKRGIYYMHVCIYHLLYEPLVFTYRNINGFCFTKNSLGHR